MNVTNSEKDWLNPQSGSGVSCLCEPPSPISGPLEEHHDPVILLTTYRDEARWSDWIAMRSKRLPSVKGLPEDEEE